MDDYGLPLIAYLDIRFSAFLVILLMGWDDALVVLALFVVSAALSALTAKKPARQQDQAPATLKEFDFPQIEEGTAQTVVFGDVWLSGWQVLWYGDLRSEGIPAEKAGGKK